MQFPQSNRLKHLSDNELIAQYKASEDKELVGVLFERYSHLVLGLCIKHLKDEAESKDAVLNIFEKLMTDLLKHDVEYFKSWLYMVAKNQCLMNLRKKQTKVNRELEIIRSETAHLEVVPDGPKANRFVSSARSLDE